MDKFRPDSVAKIKNTVANVSSACVQYCTGENSNDFFDLLYVKTCTSLFFFQFWHFHRTSLTIRYNGFFAVETFARARPGRPVWIWVTLRSSRRFFRSADAVLAAGHQFLAQTGTFVGGFVVEQAIVPAQFSAIMLVRNGSLHEIHLASLVAAVRFRFGQARSVTIHVGFA